MAHPTRVAPRPAFVVLSGLLAGVLVVAGCADPDVDALDASPPSTTVPPITAPPTIPDTRDVALDQVGGRAGGGFPITVEGGDATIRGTVRGPGGTVGGATVLLERFVGTRHGSLRVQADDDGRYRVDDAHGGRYRIRAWRSPRLGMTSSVLAFLRDEEAHDVDLDLSVQDGVDVQAVASATTVPVDGTVTITALVTRRSVGGQGIISALPMGRATATLGLPAQWDVTGSLDQGVNGDGRVQWVARCTEPGSGTATVRAESAVADLALTCEEPAADDDGGRVPYPSASLAVGNQFAPPFDAVVPAGTYTVVDANGTCGFTYQRWRAGRWEPTRRSVVGTADFTFELPGRDLRTIGDTPPCVYERLS